MLVTALPAGMSFSKRNESRAWSQVANCLTRLIAAIPEAIFLANFSTWLPQVRFASVSTPRDFDVDPGLLEYNLQTKGLFISRSGIPGKWGKPPVHYPGYQRFFSRVRRGASSAARSAKPVTLWGLTETGNRAWKASGTQGTCPHNLSF